MPIEVVSIVVYLLQATLEAPPPMHRHFLEFAGCYLGRLAEKEERRLAQARSRSLKNWLRTKLCTQSGPVHRWTKPRGWCLSQVDSDLGPTSFPGDVADAQLVSWSDAWDAED